MSTLEQCRQKSIGFVLKRDTALMEFALAVNAVINAAQVLTVEGGKPLAPFLFSAVSWLNWAGTLWAGAIWVAFLTLYGALAFVALIVGLMTGNTFFWRSNITLMGCFLWTVVGVAVATSGQPGLIAIRYGFTALLAWITALVLIVKHDYKDGDSDTDS